MKYIGSRKIKTLRKNCSAQDPHADIFRYSPFFIPCLAVGSLRVSNAQMLSDVFFWISSFFRASRITEGENKEMETNWSKPPHDATQEELILAYADGKTEEELIEKLAQEYEMHPIRKAQLWTRIQNLIAQCVLSVDQNGKLKVRR